MTNLAATLCRAAVHSAWMVYIAPPSPVNPITVLSGCASLAPIAPGIPTPNDPPRVRKYCPVLTGGRVREIDRVVLGDLVRIQVNVDRFCLGSEDLTQLGKDLRQ